MMGFDDLKHKGNDSKRLNIWNPREISFAHKWEDQNQHHNILACLLTQHPGSGLLDEPSEEEISLIVCRLKGHNIYYGWITKPESHFMTGEIELRIVKGVMCRTCLNNIKIYDK